MKEEPVTIVDREVLKVLSNDTRMDILKMLSKGDRNPSFVAKKLGKADATIVEHLKILEDVELVKKTESPGKKWVFYSLTEKGESIVKSKSRRLVIILSVSLIAFIAGFGTLAGYMYTTPLQMAGSDRMLEITDAVNKSVPAEGGTIATTGNQILLGTSLLLLGVGVIALVIYHYKKSKRGMKI